MGCSDPSLAYQPNALLSAAARMVSVGASWCPMPDPALAVIEFSARTSGVVFPPDFPSELRLHGGDEWS